MTQSGGLDLFHNVHLCLSKDNKFEKVGFYTTDSRFFNTFIKQNSDFLSAGYETVKEWEIIKEASTIKVNHSRLTEYEKQIGYPVLWNALMTDRRITWGRMFASAQDYRPRFSHDQMLAILQVALQRIEKMFDRVNPDLVITFACNTIGDYLSFLFAKSRDISFLNLRPTRIKNYIFAGEDVLEPSAGLEKTFEELLANGMDRKLEDEVIDYLSMVKTSNSKYEGVVAPSSKPPINRLPLKRFFNVFGLLRTASNLITNEINYIFGELSYDNSVAGSFKPFVSRHLVRPLRAWRIKNQFTDIYVRQDQLKELNYAFFPLHPEPEVTVIVYSKPYLNQIEAVRLVSHNLPVGMKLIVKEHPWHVGKRTIGYYRKLLNIPNVLLAAPELGTRELVKNADLITTISGSTGLEGLIMNIPVAVLGRAPFNFLSRGMIRYVKNPDELGFEIRDLLENYRYNEEAIRAYVGAVMKESVPVDFFSRLLRRKKAFNPDLSSDKDEWQIQRRKHFKLLSSYIKNRFRHQ